MSSERTKNSTLCKMGCGYFGSSATSGCCSSCWRSKMASSVNVTNTKKRRQEDEECVDASPKKRIRIEEPSSVNATYNEDVKKESTQNDDIKKESSSSPSPSPVVKKTKKNKKKKFSSILSGMLKTSKKDESKEKEALLKGLGGGAFSKIDKI